MRDSEPEKSDFKASDPNPLSLMGAGIELAGAVGGLALLGWWLDSKWSTGPWLMCIGLAMGLIGGTYKLWCMGKRFF